MRRSIRSFRYPLRRSVPRYSACSHSKGAAFHAFITLPAGNPRGRRRLPHVTDLLGCRHNIRAAKGSGMRNPLIVHAIEYGTIFAFLLQQRDAGVEQPRKGKAFMRNRDSNRWNVIGPLIIIAMAVGLGVLPVCLSLGFLPEAFGLGTSPVCEATKLLKIISPLL
jgi:hypothetical protein